VPTQETQAGVLDIAANRGACKFSRSELAGRVLWGIAWPLFRLTPRPFFWPWRVFLLRMFGAKIGRKVRINPSARVFLPWNLTIGDYATIGSGANLYSVGPIRIGARATVSQYTHICAGGHDPSSTTLELTRPPISIGEDAWVAADAFVGPGVTIGRGAIVSARAAVFANVDDMVIVSGNPARPQGFRDIQN